MRDYQQQVARARASQTAIERYETPWDFFEFHSAPSHEKAPEVERIHATHTRTHDEIVWTFITDKLQSVKTTGAAVITLMIGIGDPPADDRTMGAVLESLEDMRRVQVISSEYIEAEAVPIRIYCFRSRGWFHIEVNHLDVAEDQISDPFHTSVKMEISAGSAERGPNFSRLKDDLISLSHIPFKGKEEIALWKKAIAEVYVTSPSIKGIVDDETRGTIEQTSPDLARRVIEMLKGSKSQTSRPLSVISV